jgi:hypothetical protein
MGVHGVDADLASLTQKLSILEERYRKGAVLPGFAYADASVFDLEIERLFRQEWISVACGQNVPAYLGQSPDRLLKTERHSPAQ